MYCNQKYVLIIWTKDWKNINVALNAVPFKYFQSDELFWLSNSPTLIVHVDTVIRYSSAEIKQYLLTISPISAKEHIDVFPALDKYDMEETKPFKIFSLKTLSRLFIKWASLEKENVENDELTTLLMGNILW